MPFRRSHKKSRKGCLQCKQRHVKCDEKLPSCSLCKKRKLACTYPRPPESERQSSASQGETETGTLATAAPTDLPQARRMLEMRLLHHFLMVTSRTLVNDDLDEHHWQVVIPRIAMSHGYVLDSMLAFSALHLAFLGENDTPSWLQTALKYQNQAVSGLSKTLTQINVEDYEPAFVCSIFVMVFATAYSGVSGDRHPTDPLAEVLEVRTLMTGSAFLLMQMDSSGRKLELAQWFKRDREGEKHQDAFLRAQQKQKENPKLVELHSFVMNELRKLRATIDSTVSPHQDVYRATYKFLYDVIEPWPLSHEGGGIMAWPIHISDTFIDLLKEGDWMSRILFMFYGVGMHLLSDKWFAEGSGRRLILGLLQPLVGEVPSAWVKTVVWMRQAVEID